MRIAVFSDTFVPQVNGVALTLKRWTEYLSAGGDECRLFLPTEPEPVYENLVFQLASIPFWAYPGYRFAIPNLLRIRKELSLFKPDIVHIATPFSVGLAGMYAAQKLQIPIIASYHTHFNQYLESYWFPFAHSWYWSYMKWFHRHCRAVFAPSQETIQQLQSNGLSNLELWSRGIDCDRFTPAKRSGLVRELYGIKERYLLLYVGRLAPEKDLNVLLQLMHRLPERISSQVHWLVVGDGPLLEQGRREAPQNVTFTGFQNGDELAALYASSDVFVFPSASETFGNVVLEAAASGLPAIVADRGGVTEIVRHEGTGLHAKAGNVESFLAALCDWFDEPDKWRRFGMEARVQAEGRTWDQAMGAIYTRCQQIVQSEQHSEAARNGYPRKEGESA
ncbi:glycosyltransferase family 4 protein [Paenibacillus sanguinis]|uniref:glycosyltransferase family 4 protein n=1 Tax=Paenibacillus sanguinis TaxID=225906 RepID=UPI00037F8FE8|nr:glycosyltransferase family 1 protein [Paenibacillus sanguinis]